MHAFSQLKFTSRQTDTRVLLGYRLCCAVKLKIELHGNQDYFYFEIRFPSPNVRTKVGHSEIVTNE